jgi:hypothetical protein
MPREPHKFDRHVEQKVSRVGKGEPHSSSFAERAITRSINVRVRFGGEGDTSFRHMGFGKGATIVAT